MFLFRRLGLYIAVAVALLGVVLPAAQASAQTPGQAPTRAPLSLTTSPLPLNVVTKPGQTVTADIRVKNNSTTPERLKVELLKFGASGDTGRPQLQERTQQDVYFNWVSFSENNFTAEPNVWKTVKMTVKAPKEAAFGYYFAVLFSRETPDRPTGGNSAVEGGVASLVLLNVDTPGAKRQAEVVELTASQKVYEFLPAKFGIKLKNSGNVHVSPVGSMFIKQGDKQVASINFNEERGNILPGTNRVFDMNWSDGFPVFEEKGEGENKTKSLKWEFGELQKLRFGRYTATLVAVYDDGVRDVPIEAVVSFWVIPWRILGVILLILLFFGFGVWAILRLIWKNLKRQAREPRQPKDDGSSGGQSSGPDPNSLAAARMKAIKPQETKAEDEIAARAPSVETAAETAPIAKAPSAPPLPPSAKQQGAKKPYTAHKSQAKKLVQDSAVAETESGSRSAKHAKKRHKNRQNKRTDRPGKRAEGRQNGSGSSQ